MKHTRYVKGYLHRLAPVIWDADGWDMGIARGRIGLLNDGYPVICVHGSDAANAGARRWAIAQMRRYHAGRD